MPTSLQTPQTLPTAYTQGATLGPIQNLEKIVWQNTGGVVLFQVASLDPSGKPVFDQTEAALPPGIWGMDKIQGIRFRSRDPGSLATIDPVTGYFEDDPDPFNPGNIPGTTTAITGAVNVQHNGALVGSQPTIDFIDSADVSFGWTVNNDGANTRVTITPPNVVRSFNTRTGSVVPTSGDYTAAQVTNAADKSSVSTQTFSGDIQAPGLQVNNVNFGGLGYVPGAGGSAIQAGSLSSTVTVNAYSGQITTFASALANGLVVTFSVNCNVIASTDTVVVSWRNVVQQGIPIFVSNINGGVGFNITYINLSGVLTASQTNTMNFAIIKAAAS